MRTYGRLQLAGERWLIPELEPHVCIRLKKIFPKIGVATIAPFSLPNSPDIAADLAWFTKRYPLEISNEDQKQLKNLESRFFDQQTEVERILSRNFQPRGYSLKPGQQLRPYQAQAVEMLRRTGTLLLGDVVGLGKTYVGLGACTYRDALPAVVVCQAHMPSQWAEKASEFTNLRVHIIKQTKPYKLPEADLYIVSYHKIRHWVDYFGQKPFKLAIFDEAQELRTGKASSKGIAASHLCCSAKQVLALTATPIYNYGGEIWEILNTLKAGSLGTYNEFIREWCNSGCRSGKPIVHDPKALGAYLREIHLFLRRTREDVGQYLDPVNHIVKKIGFNKSAAENSLELARILAIKTLEGASFHEQGMAARELDLLLRRVTGVSKAKHVAGFVRMILESGEPVLLAGWHRDVYDIWLEELSSYKPVMYTGSESPTKKERAKQAFINGETNLMIISLRSGIGLDGLQHRCATAVFGELDWSPEVHHQLIGRLHREGQARSVMAVFLYCDYGSDPPMTSLLGLKASQAQGIVDPHLGVQKRYMDESRLKNMARDFLDRNGLLRLNRSK
jgi:SNF2 family DNA or RNA helicase